MRRERELDDDTVDRRVFGELGNSGAKGVGVDCLVEMALLDEDADILGKPALHGYETRGDGIIPHSDDSERRCALETRNDLMQAVLDIFCDLSSVDNHI